MKKTSLTLLVLSFNLVLLAQNENPFKKLGYDVLTATSSKGEFTEFHDQTDIVEIGSVLYNTKNNEIVKVLGQGETTVDISSATAAMSIDPLCEKYYWISPYAYCANNPIRFIDLRGDSISVAEEHRTQFRSDLENTFGSRASSLAFNSNGNLVLNGKEKDFTNGMTKDQKKAYDGLKKAMNNKETASVVYGNQYSSNKTGGLNSTDIVKDWGGGVYSAVDQVIVISPTVGSVSVNLTLEGVQATGSFTETVQQNVTSTLFHEIGEFNTPQSDTKRGKVIDYENSVRNVLGLPKRPYDLYHHK
ncbi:hypothetical protein [Bacteroides sp. 214]|uniref:hypothetical protein n=1 Tax=Bacteroides sp. 214 TaxID=2302935 RepID=UPI001EF1A8BD|nr:hypothetical protein [Bacteroides sp. 214]